ncbi:hypothetical protein V502_06903 [Pseudogymnoascus sp. VKM F-4520 (FW-2644)]|nr:hypothetical protein V502_06903 [Pseudogymnoascus sp. VKM F-4520 (FW-2644)]
MAEALAIIGLVSNAIQLTEVCIKVCNRAREYASNSTELPKAFRGLQSCLPLIKNSLEEIRTRVKLKQINDATCKALVPVIEGCEAHMRDLQSIFEKVLPNNNDSKLGSAIKVMLSLGFDRDVKTLEKEISRDIGMLTLHYATDGAIKATSLKELMSSSTEAAFLVHYARNQHFIGRQAQIEELHSRLKDHNSHNRAVLVGLGGIGKSQVAIEFAYQYREKHPGAAIYWIHASDASRFEVDYLQIGIQVRLPGMMVPNKDPKELVREWLCTKASGRWLMIVDNADDVSDFFPDGTTEKAKGLAQFLPTCGNGSIVITTRNKKAGVKFATSMGIIILERMDPFSAEKIFNARVGGDKSATNDVAELLKLLDYLPLAIAQAASYIAENSIPIVEYLEMLKDSEETAMELLGEDFEEPGRDSTSSNTVATVWAISFDQIRSKDTLAGDILCSMACFDRQAIPKDLLTSTLGPVRLATALGLLKGYSLITQGKNDHVFEMHRLVYLATRNWLRKNGNFVTWAEASLQTMLQKFPSGKHGTLDKCDLYLPHAQAILACQALLHREDVSKASLAHKVSLCLQNRGRYTLAESMAQNAVEWRECAFGKEHELTLASESNLAFVLGMRGKYDMAYKMHTKVLESQERVLGPDSLDTVRSVGYVAEMLRKLGRYAEAESLHRRALDCRVRIQGEEHVETLSTVDDLAWVLLEQGHYPEAETLQRRALAGREKVLGPVDPETLASVSDLAIVLRKQGKYEVAEELQQRAVNGRTKVLGPKHPYTLWSKSDLAAVLRKQGRYDVAEELHREVYHGRREVLGSDHRYTLWSISDLGSVAFDRGNIEEAENLQLQALKGRRAILGNEHPDTLTSLSKLAMVSRHRGNLDAARNLNQQVLSIRKRVLGKDHPATLSSAEDLATVS